MRNRDPVYRSLLRLTTKIQDIDSSLQAGRRNQNTKSHRRIQLLLFKYSIPLLEFLTIRTRKEETILIRSKFIAHVKIIFYLHHPRTISTLEKEEETRLLIDLKYFQESSRINSEFLRCDFHLIIYT